MLLVSSHPGRDDHDPGEGHPEHVGRLFAAAAGLEAPPLRGATEWLEPRRASRDELSVVHDTGYLNTLMDMCAAGGGQVDPDTVVSAGSWETAQLTAGAGLQAIEALTAGRGDAAFVLGRPPGHHAGPAAGMGFCLVNNVAVAAATLTRRGERVAVVDWDVHHGNGTQDIFWSDPSVLYVSVHQWPLYPGTGRPEDRGAGAGRGTTINLPMPPRSTGDAYLALFDEVVLPCLDRFGPTWVLVSAGFDAHRDDPLGDMALTAGDFADLTGRLVGSAREPGRLVLFLEGGYDLPALQASVAACAACLVGDPYRPEPASSGGAGMSRVADYRATFVTEASHL
jgi:acetoin utilization deacetylase AcuC-like enzyme